jgi:GNAT superfamily N-acetyltransferase
VLGYRFKKANARDSEDLTLLAFRSKAYWGYSEEQMEQWRDELMVTEAFIKEREVHMIIKNESLAGFYGYLPLDEQEVKLEFFFLDPDFIGQGLGALLLGHSIKTAQEAGYESMVLDADPNAEAFYLKHGFDVIGQLESSIKGRYLPIMRRKL